MRERKRTKRNFSKSEKTKEKMLRIYMFRTSEKKKKREKIRETTTTKND